MGGRRAPGPTRTPTRVVALTSYPLQEDVERALGAGGGLRLTAAGVGAASGTESVVLDRKSDCLVHGFG